MSVVLFVWFQEVCFRTSIPSEVSDQSRSSPGVRVVALVPIYETSTACKPRDCGPAPTETDVVFLVEEISCVSRIQIHCFEPFIFPQWGAGPFPETTCVTLTTKTAALARDWSRVPGLERDVAAT